MASYQRNGAVRDFWAYFNATCERYVGQNAEEIQAEATSAGAHVGAVLAEVLQRAGTTKATALPELLAKRAE